MIRPHAVTSIATISFCLAGSACEAMLGGIDVKPAPEGAEQASGSIQGGAPPAQRPDPRGDDVNIPFGNPAFGEVFPPLVVPPVDVSNPSGADGGAGELDAGPTPLVVRPVVVDGPVAELERVGVAGGQPHLGACQGGVVIGVRPTANPSEEVFGQRLTFIEPICGMAAKAPSGSIADPAAASITMVRDDSILSWDATGDFQGPPRTEVPDPRLIWVAQPATFCPDTAPALVGLSGEYDPIAPDAMATAALRSLVIECAPLVVSTNGVDVLAADAGHQFVSQAGSFTAVGTAAYGSVCEGGSVTTQIQLHAGFWLDGFVLGCSTLRSPNVAGEPCLAERECQSGTCAAEGTCAP